MLQGAVGYRPAPPLELFVSVERTWLGVRTRTALPDAERWTFMLALRGVFAPRFGLHPEATTRVELFGGQP